jgi:hypothetical protein
MAVVVQQLISDHIKKQFGFMEPGTRFDRKKNVIIKAFHHKFVPEILICFKLKIYSLSFNSPSLGVTPKETDFNVLPLACLDGDLKFGTPALTKHAGPFV